MGAWLIRFAFAKDGFSQFSILATLLVVFLITGAMGYCAVYDSAAGWNKFYLIIATILLDYAPSSQSKENLIILAFFWLIRGSGIATYFLLTHDSTAFPTKFYLIQQLGLLWMRLRPQVHAPGIDPNDASALSIVTSICRFLTPRDHKKARLLLREARSNRKSPDVAHQDAESPG